MIERTSDELTNQSENSLDFWNTLAPEERVDTDRKSVV